MTTYFTSRHTGAIDWAVRHHPNGPFHGESVSAVAPANRVINLTLPPDFPIGPVEVVLISKARWRDSAT